MTHDLPQSAEANSLRLAGEASSLLVGESKPFLSLQFLQDSDLFPEVIDHIFLLLADPARQTNHHQLHHVHLDSLAFTQHTCTIRIRSEHRHANTLGISRFRGNRISGHHVRLDPVPFFPNKSLLQPVPSIALAKNTGCSGGPRLADLDGQQ